ncbi:PLP-dependent aminotransferase family protein [Demequina aurantiaca]|uniref:aminotransferase-like domain-containing protein n=1 Tax=Demequina aurantiaca TaxID=676200 RepID=UPI003D34715E
MLTTLSAEELNTTLGHWASGRGTLVDDLSEALIELIEAGVLPAGITMPAQRALAPAIGVSRGTVMAAYATLERHGYMLSRRGSGSQIRSKRTSLRTRPQGRLFSFSAQPGDVIDMSTGALPASRVAQDVLLRGIQAPLADYLTTDGYFPAGLPVLRRAIASQLTDDGVPTSSDEILVTAGAQQATWLVIRALVTAGDQVLVEEPSYRGALEILREHDARVRGIPLVDGGISVPMVRAALKAEPRLLYCQTGIHNPTGTTMHPTARGELAKVINEHGLLTVEDRCWSDLLLSGPPVAKGLAGLVAPDLLITIGTFSKLFWGGLRVGWVRSSPKRIEALTELLKSTQLACSVPDQLYAARLIGHTAEARAERRDMLVTHVEQAEAIFEEMVPSWRWGRIDGGSGLWIDTCEDTSALVARAKRVGVKLLAGPSFSTYDGQRTMIRLPVWHEAAQLRQALALLTQEAL